VRTRVIASDSFGWADEIPKLVNGHTTLPDYELPSAAVHDRHDLLAAWPHWNNRMAGGPA